METEEDHITPLLPEAIEKLQRVFMWGFSPNGTASQTESIPVRHGSRYEEATQKR